MAKDNTKKTNPIDANLLKKLKPMEIGKKNKKEKKKEQKNSSEEIDSKMDSPGRGFSDNSIWQTKGFVAPAITRSESESVPLEKTAEESPVQNQNNNNEKETIYSTEKTPRSESSAYRVSSNYESKTAYDSGRAGEVIRSAISLGNEQRRTGLINPFIRQEDMQRSELEEFSRLDEQRRIEREEKEKLPFMQKNRREEIF